MQQLEEMVLGLTVAARIARIRLFDSPAYWMPYSSSPVSPSVRPSKPMIAEWPKYE